MKKIKFTPLHCLIVLCAAVLLCGLGLFSACETSGGHGHGDYRYELTDYDVTYDIGPDCEIAVTEILNVHYLGRDSTGFLRDIPANSGETVKDINVTGIELVDGGSDVPFEVRIEDNDFVTVDIGSSTGKHNMSETYRLTYTYCLTNPVINSGSISVNPVGTGWDCEIKHAKVTLLLPGGYVEDSAVRYLGEKGEGNTDRDFTVTERDGRTVITTEAENLAAHKGISFDLNFQKGAVKAYFDFTPYWFAIGAAALILIILAVKFLLFNREKLIPVINFEAPENMDPLIMGKLIDNKVNSEDVTALIYYWADKGYLKINLDDKNDPVLIRIKNLPALASDYEKVVFDGLFRTGDSVKTSELRYVFYRTFERATAMVNEKSKGLYSSTSIGVSIIFALVGGLFAGLVPLILAMMIPGCLYFYGFIAIIPALVMYAVTESVAYNRLKRRGKKNALYYLLVAVLILACSAIFMLVIPNSVMPLIPKILTLVLSFTAVALSVSIISRTKQYNEKLNEIVGFRNFILTAEKDRLEKLIEDNPQFYYHVLPYAQVLNVSDVWEEKFKDITLAPPGWAVGSSLDNLTSFLIINSMIRRTTTTISSGMISRPSSSGRSGGGGGFGGFGGHFGGSAGGGFGGGGGRGR